MPARTPSGEFGLTHVLKRPATGWLARFAGLFVVMVLGQDHHLKIQSPREKMRGSLRAGPPPSEPDRRLSRIRLSSQWAPFGDWVADALALVIVKSPSFAK